MSFLGTVETFSCTLNRAYHSTCMKNGRLVPALPPMERRYTPHTCLPQPPDDRTYSAEVTVFRRNLLHHRSARSLIPNSRSLIIIHRAVNVKHYFGFFHNFFENFLYITEKIILPIQHAQPINPLVGDDAQISPLQDQKDCAIAVVRTAHHCAVRDDVGIVPCKTGRNANKSFAAPYCTKTGRQFCVLSRKRKQFTA